MTITPTAYSWLVLVAGLTIATSTSAADKKGVHGNAFACLHSTNCAGLQTGLGGLANTSAGVRTAYLPLLRDLDGNIDLELFFKFNASAGSTCQALWYDTSGTITGSDNIELVAPLTHQYRDTTVNSPTAYHATVVVCTLSSGATLVSAVYNEG